MKRELYNRWKRLVNMTALELERFMNSAEGREAGLSRSEANRAGIKYGRQSARWLLKMIPTGQSFAQAERNWTPAMWEWAKRQVSFISRMRGVSGPLVKNGKKTPKYTALLIWGHNPMKIGR
jgi:hypothetical protein